MPDSNNFNPAFLNKGGIMGGPEETAINFTPSLNTKLMVNSLNELVRTTHKMTAEIVIGFEKMSRRLENITAGSYTNRRLESEKEFKAWQDLQAKREKEDTEYRANFIKADKYFFDEQAKLSKAFAEQERQEQQAGKKGFLGKLWGDTQALSTSVWELRQVAAPAIGIFKQLTGGALEWDTALTQQRRSLGMTSEEFTTYKQDLLRISKEEHLMTPEVAELGETYNRLGHSLKGFKDAGRETTIKAWAYDFQRLKFDVGATEEQASGLLYTWTQMFNKDQTGVSKAVTNWEKIARTTSLTQEQAIGLLNSSKDWLTVLDRGGDSTDKMFRNFAQSVDQADKLGMSLETAMSHRGAAGNIGSQENIITASMLSGLLGRPVSPVEVSRLARVNPANLEVLRSLATANRLQQMGVDPNSQEAMDRMALGNTSQMFAQRDWTGVENELAVARRFGQTNVHPDLERMLAGRAIGKTRGVDIDVLGAGSDKLEADKKAELGLLSDQMKIPGFGSLFYDKHAMRQQTLLARGAGDKFEYAGDEHLKLSIAAWSWALDKTANIALRLSVGFDSTVMSAKEAVAALASFAATLWLAKKMLGGGGKGGGGGGIEEDGKSGGGGRGGLLSGVKDALVGAWYGRKWIQAIRGAKAVAPEVAEGGFNFLSETWPQAAKAASRFAGLGRVANPIGAASTAVELLGPPTLEKMYVGKESEYQRTHPQWAQEKELETLLHRHEQIGAQKGGATSQAARSSLDAMRKGREASQGTWLPFFGNVTMPWQKHVKTEAKAESLTDLFPKSKPYEAAILRDAAEYGVDPMEIAALIEVETRGTWNPHAKNKKSGASGLMQLLPSTAKEMGLHGNIFDPEENIRAGTKYFAKQMANFGGDSTLAEAAYNAGPGAVRRHGGVPPYPETQDYILRMSKLNPMHVTVDNHKDVSGNLVDLPKTIGAILTPVLRQLTAAIQNYSGPRRSGAH